jgi:arginine deiminase
MGIHVFNEIGTLKKVLLHRPGDEFLNLTPNTLQRLLFDDIPYLKKAQEEHDAFAEALRKEGVEVVYLVDLMAETLDSNPKLRSTFIKQFIREGGVTSDIVFDLLYKYLNSFKDNKILVSKCIAGIDSEDLKGYRPSSGFFATRDIGKMILDPLPNLYAPRDPFASIGRGVSIHKMYSVTRSRETIFAEYIFKYHPKYKTTPRYYERTYPYSIEGGDIEVLSKEVIAIGISERTEPDAINLLAQKIFKTKNNTFKYILAFDIPDERSFMHLDTVLTRVDVDKFTVHSQVMEVTKVFEITKGDKELKIKELNMPLDELLKKYLKLNKIELIKCGGGKRIPAEREQWSDGANLLAVRPGVAIAYDRNHVSNEVFRRHGLKIIEIPSSELSRGRGGPHCMSMALEREDL